MAYLVDISTALPPYILPQSVAAEGLKQRMGGQAALVRLIDAAAGRSDIATRRVVIPDGEPGTTVRFYPETSDGTPPDTKRRMEMYKEWSARLAVDASASVVASAHASPHTIDRLITVSCTGFSAPNFDYQIIASLGLIPRIRRTHIGFMGCAAALVGLTSVLESSRAGPSGVGSTLLVSVELCSLHLQIEPTKDNILANLLFADGCAAALFSPERTPLARARLLSTDSMLFEESTRVMGWEIGNHGFEMVLSPDLPSLIAEQAVPAAKNILAGHGLRPEDIRHWALHPGGRAILDALQTGLHLTDEQTAPSRNVLRNFGNMSSASILYVIKELLSGVTLAAGDRLCAIAFGPGLTMEIAIFGGA
jgi:predicted naringenin-chalcone synthase